MNTDEQRMKIFDCEIPDIDAAEFYDDVALRELKRLDPEMPQKLIEQTSKMPIYDGKEVIATVEYFKDNPPMMAMFCYVAGNNDPKLNGWVMRLFVGVRYNDDKHIAILKAFEKRCKGRLETSDF